MTRKGCTTCIHRARPGRVDVGYCAGREDLPPAYGEHHPLRQLPAGRGAACEKWEEVK